VTDNRGDAENAGAARFAPDAANARNPIAGLTIEANDRIGKRA